MIIFGIIGYAAMQHYSVFIIATWLKFDPFQAVLEWSVGSLCLKWSLDFYVYIESEQSAVCVACGVYRKHSGHQNIILPVFDQPDCFSPISDGSFSCISSLSSLSCFTSLSSLSYFSSLFSFACFKLLFCSCLHKEERREEYQPGGEGLGRKARGSTSCWWVKEGEESVEHSANGLTGVKAELDDAILLSSPRLSSTWLPLTIHHQAWGPDPIWHLAAVVVAVATELIAEPPICNLWRGSVLW